MRLAQKSALLPLPCAAYLPPPQAVTRVLLALWLQQGFIRDFRQPQVIQDVQLQSHFLSICKNLFIRVL